MSYQEYYDYLQKNYQPLHPSLYNLTREIFLEPVIAAFEEASPDSLMKLCRETHPGIFVFDLLKPSFCKDMLAELANFEDWSAQQQLKLVRPNTMNNYGVILNGIGFDLFLQKFMIEYIKPISTLVYADVGGDSLDSCYGFVVEYQEGKDLSLDFHVDASDVTLNICLGKEFTGGELFFRGVRCHLCQQTPALDAEKFEIEHVPGRAILHRGKHRHGANPILSGERYNLILWCNSSRFQQQEDKLKCPTWCGRHRFKQ